MGKGKKQIIIKILVSAVLVAINFTRIDFRKVLESFSLIDVRYLFLLVSLLILNYVVSSVRWKTLLIHNNSDKAGVGYLTRLYFIGAFFNNFMPTSIGGDVYKVLALGKRLGNKADAFTSTFMERFTGVVALILISYFGFITFGFWDAQLPSFISANALYLGIFKFILFFGFLFGIVISFSLLKTLSKKFVVLEKVYNSFLAYKGKRGVLVSAFLTSFVVQLLGIFTQYFVFASMGVKIEFSYALFVFPVITLASFFIPSLNGLGVQDTLYVQFFSASGEALALSASIIYHLLRLFVSLFGGILYAFNKTDQ